MVHGRPAYRKPGTRTGASRKTFSAALVGLVGGKLVRPWGRPWGSRLAFGSRLRMDGRRLPSSEFGWTGAPGREFVSIHGLGDIGSEPPSTRFGLERSEPPSSPFSTSTGLGPELGPRRALREDRDPVLARGRSLAHRPRRCAGAVPRGGRATRPPCCGVLGVEGAHLKGSSQSLPPCSCSKQLSAKWRSSTVDFNFWCWYVKLNPMSE